MKIYIIGPSGSGKTTLANKLSEKYNTENYELDCLVYDDDHDHVKRSDKEIEKLFNDILERNSEKSISCDSAATSTEEIGNPVHYGTRNVLQRHGIPVGNHRARQMTLQDYKDFDLL